MFNLSFWQNQQCGLNRSHTLAHIISILVIVNDDVNYPQMTFRNSYDGDVKVY